MLQQVAILNVCVALSMPQTAAPPVLPAFQADGHIDLAALEAIVSSSTAEFAVAQRQARVAHAEWRQARILHNPILDGGHSTIPIGQTNPPNLATPMRNVPNYSVGITYAVPLAKRSWRIHQAKALAKAADHERDAQRLDLALGLAELLGEMAGMVLRRELLRSSVRRVDALRLAVPIDHKHAHQLVEIIQRERAASFAGDEGEQELLAQTQGLLVGCAALVGRPCKSFADAEQASRFLQAWSAPIVTDASTIDQRHDLAALLHYQQAAHAGLKLAKRAAIPEPTVRFGYLHDRFVISGNQRNSLGVGIALPLPIFDHGQAKVAAAQAMVDGLAAEHQRRVASAHAQLTALSQWIVLEQQRHRTLKDVTLPAALAELETMQVAFVHGDCGVDKVQAQWQWITTLELEELGTRMRMYEASLQWARILPTAAAKVEAPAR